MFVMFDSWTFRRQSRHLALQSYEKLLEYASVNDFSMHFRQFFHILEPTAIQL